MSYTEEYLAIIKDCNKRFITLIFIALRYVIVTVGFAALTTLAKWCVASDHVPYGNAAFDWLFIAFYTVITAIFVIHLAVFIFWRDK